MGKLEPARAHSSSKKLGKSKKTTKKTKKMGPAMRPDIPLDEALVSNLLDRIIWSSQLGLT